MAIVYGDSYGEVARNELGLDAARDNRYFQGLADQRSRQAQAEAYAIQQQQLAQARDQQQAALAQAFQTHQDEVNYRDRALAQNASLFHDQLQNSKDLANLTHAHQQDVLDTTNNRRLYDEAFSAITNGTVRTPAHLDALVGNSLKPDEKSRLRQYLDEGHLRQANQYAQAQQQADNLQLQYSRAVAPYQSAAATAQEQITNAPSAANKHWYTPWNWLSTTKEELQANPPLALRNLNTADANFQKQLEKDKRLSGMISQDAGTHRFVPTMVAPDDYPGAPAATWHMPAPESTPTPGATTNANAAPVPVLGGQTVAPWVPIPGTNLEAHPDELNDILSKANALTPSQGESPTAFDMRRKMYAANLAREAAANYGTVRQIAADPTELASAAGNDLMSVGQGF